MSGLPLGPSTNRCDDQGNRDDPQISPWNPDPAKRMPKVIEPGYFYVELWDTSGDWEPIAEQLGSISPSYHRAAQARRPAPMPPRSPTLAVLAAAVSVGLSAGCAHPATTANPTSGLASSTRVPTGTSSSVATEPTSDHGLHALCDSQPWPLPVPALAGLVLEQVESGSLFCFDNVRAQTATGDDPLNSNNQADINGDNAYRITSTSPPAGTRIGRNDLLTVAVTKFDAITQQPAFHPCAWIAPEEVAAVLATRVPSTLTAGDEAGSTDRSCFYNTGESLITSELKVDGALLIDADTEYHWRIAKDRGTAITSLPVPATCATTEGGDKGSNRSLYAKLGDNRIYQILGGPDSSCDQLTQLAAIAIPRFGP